MAITYDFIHDEEVADAVIDQLEANLPAAWRSRANAVLGLRRIEFGSLNQYRFSGRPGDENIGDLLPSIWVRMGSQDAPEHSAIGGKEGQATLLTIVHVFGEEQCYDLTTPSRRVQVERAKAQRAKAISKALWYHATDSKRRKLGDPTLTTDDTKAFVIDAHPGSVNYAPPEEAALGVYAVALGIRVNTRTH